jgi:hypothetical protein
MTMEILPLVFAHRNNADYIAKPANLHDIFMFCLYI